MNIEFWHLISPPLSKPLFPGMLFAPGSAASHLYRFPSYPPNQILRTECLTPHAFRSPVKRRSPRDIIAGDQYVGSSAAQVSLLLEKIHTEYRVKAFDGRSPMSVSPHFRNAMPTAFLGAKR